MCKHGMVTIRNFRDPQRSLTIPLKRTLRTAKRISQTTFTKTMHAHRPFQRASKIFWGSPTREGYWGSSS